ncbi:NADP-dependent phosphogluconate dehydrogenase [Actinobacteria bacterium YIM 96077]|uniref:6-phosphogluconate dehydrogenase, decarboxylating n=1 Tax=Phytoactinopolyspora halophila TaxID=1981511 RepID=A0A329R2V1_9ACTN|nr:NADP-dependent phosphogluconate dehydrogenase [Phytoactinopolyspora halophila]AYY11858.1 NADP-dependent phosphogluconate dehydrogenase [Actinobacteria bacterium YIM 96077]RAW18910.1 phosphogluconate dehydrogenase (NADP(+)-dependent, decarboxylating) [Phytoactinopolyspora halophila]
MADEQLADVAVTGLGTMGGNLARNLARNGYRVAAHNRSRHRTDELIGEFGHEGDFVPVSDLAELAGTLRRPRRVILMVPAGAPTDAVIDKLRGVLESGDIVVDAGNAHFEDTRRREATLREDGIHFVGTGVSGGEEGALHGPSIMPGGSAEAYAALEPMLTSIAAEVDGTPCCTHVGPDGAGHFVKMLHNGIEYADMQLIAESYDLLRRGLGMEPAEIAEVFATWNSGDLESFLVEITADVLGHTDHATGEPFIDVVLDQAGQKGTGRWTVISALELGVPVSGMAEAVFARGLSGDVDRRSAARGVLRGPSETPAVGDRQWFVDDVRDALYASKLVAYAQGFDVIREASDEYGWGVDLGQMATIWRGGCIIRARFLDRIREAYDRDPGLSSLLVDSYFRDAVIAGQAGWRRVVATAAQLGIPVPGFSSALAYYDGLRSERLPAALIQGQRDLFGAHTYQRVDRPGTFHVDWAGDRAEEER